MIEALSARLAGALEKRPALFLVLFSAVYFAAGLALASTKLMDFDELATYHPARLGSIGEVVRFFYTGGDVHTPLPSLTDRFWLSILGERWVHVAVRLTPLIGFWLMSVALFVLISRRAPVLYAAVAAVFPLVTSVFPYAYEGRGYGLELGCAAWALVFWQNILDNRKRWSSLAALWLVLAVALWCHYYAAFLWVPLGLAEAARTIERKRVDWAVWVVLVTAPLPLVFWLPAMKAAHAVYSGGYWTRPHFGKIEDSYRFLFTLAFAPMTLAGLLWLIFAPGGKRQASRLTIATRRPELVLWGSLALLPFFAVPLSMLAGAFTERYVLCTIAGFTAYSAFLAARRSGGDSVLGMILLVTFGGWFLLKVPGTVRGQMAVSGGLPFRAPSPYRGRPWMPLLEQSDLPIAVTPAVFFFELQQYSAPALRARLFYPSSREIALRLEGTDTGDANLLQFAKWFPVQTPDYASFVKNNPRFLLWAETTNPTWLVEQLRLDGATLKLLQRHEREFVFEVARRGDRNGFARR